MPSLRLKPAAQSSVSPAARPECTTVKVFFCNCYNNYIPSLIATKPLQIVRINFLVTLTIQNVCIRSDIFVIPYINRTYYCKYIVNNVINQINKQHKKNTDFIVNLKEKYSLNNRFVCFVNVTTLFFLFCESLLVLIRILVFIWTTNYNNIERNNITVNKLRPTYRG